MKLKCPECKTINEVPHVYSNYLKRFKTICQECIGCKQEQRFITETKIPRRLAQLLEGRNT